MAVQMNAGMPGAGAPAMPGQPQQNFQKLYDAEAENLELSTPESHRWACDEVEERLLKLYKLRLPAIYFLYQHTMSPFALLVICKPSS